MNNIYRLLFCIAICINCSIEGSSRRFNSFQQRSHEIQNFSKVPKQYQFVQDGILHIIYPNRFGTMSIAKAPDFHDDIKYQFNKITSPKKRLDYREMLIEKGFINKTTPHIYKQLKKLPYVHKNGEYRLF